MREIKDISQSLHRRHSENFKSRDILHQAEKRKKEWKKDILTVQPENWSPIIKKIITVHCGQRRKSACGRDDRYSDAMLVNITNAEFVTSLGADIIMLNIFDVDHPVINGLPEVAPEDTIHEVKRLTGRMVAINLEPAAVRNDGEKSVWSLTEGRRATVENAKKQRTWALT